MATFLWTKERTGELWDGRDKREGGGTATTVPSGPPPGDTGPGCPLFWGKAKAGPSTHTKVNTAMIPTVTSSCTEMMA